MMTPVAARLACREVRWIVCHTKPRCEKKFAAALSALGIEHYLPLVESVRQYAFGQTKRFSKPLFPSYVFACVSILTQSRIYEQQLLVRTLAVENESAFLRQLDQVKAAVASGLAIALQPQIKKGRKVRIKSGPLWGLVGIVDDSTDIQGVILEVDILRQGLLVKVPLEQMETLPYD